MKTPHRRLLRWLGDLGPARVVVVLVWLGAGSTGSLAQTPALGEAWAYRLTADSTLLDECPPCDHLSAPVPMRGSFDLRLSAQTPISATYALENIQFTAGDRPYKVVGGGTLEIGGEVAVKLTMTLTVQIDDLLTNKTCYFTNLATTTVRTWPMLDITLGQTNGVLAQVYTLRLAAAPMRDLWFSTASPFTANSGATNAHLVQGGDLLSLDGRVVKRNADLFTKVGAFPPGPDLGLDAVDLLPGGEIAFSLGTGISSTTLGRLQAGDLLSTRGRILARNQGLLAAFAPGSTNDAGLDAAHVADTGEILFSTASEVFSGKLNTMLGRGDLLSNTGTVRRTNRQLLAQFHPIPATNDYGLDAVYLWPSGEIWFSTEKGFQDQILGAIGDGDLLSDAGYVVFRNPDLLTAFAPAAGATNFGLDALYIVTDATPAAPTPALTAAVDGASRGVGLSWVSLGRVFELYAADSPAGPFLPLGPVQPDPVFVDPGALTNRAGRFYRIDQW